MAKRKGKIRRLWRRIYPNRKYKDRLFQRVFEDKKDLLELYNAVNHTSYQDADALEITTLEDVIYLSMKNDLSFIISSSLNLYEHQSTFNPNMPVRGLLYFARLYEAYIEKHKLNIYGEKPISLPVPQYIVFYNGKKQIPEEMLLRLSDMFMPLPEGGKASEVMLECVARVYNINPGYNENLLSGCRRLHDYSYFIAEINRNIDKGMSLEEAIFTAMDICIKLDILADILIKNRSEVYQMLLTKYDEQEVLEATYQDGLAEGFEEGHSEGVEDGQKRVNRLNLALLEQDRIEDMKRAAIDYDYQEKLFREFGI